MVIVKCKNCMNEFQSVSKKGKSWSVLGCAKCTRLFPDKAIDDILTEFKRNF